MPYSGKPRKNGNGSRTNQVPTVQDDNKRKYSSYKLRGLGMFIHLAGVAATKESNAVELRKLVDKTANSAATLAVLQKEAT